MHDAFERQRRVVRVEREERRGWRRRHEDASSFRRFFGVLFLEARTNATHTVDDAKPLLCKNVVGGGGGEEAIFYGTSAPRPRGRGKPATTTRSSSFSSQDDHGSLRAKAKRRNPRMSVIEAVSAAIGSFAIGSVAAYLVEQQEEERQQQQQQQQQKEREEKEKRQNDTNEKEKKTKSSTWRIFKEAKAEAAASPAKRIRNGKICARNAVDERGSIETRVRASYKDNVCHVIDF